VQGCFVVLILTLGMI